MIDDPEIFIVDGLKSFLSDFMLVSVLGWKVCKE